MFNKYGTLMLCAVLVFNTHSFCSDWSGTITRRSSASHSGKLDNIQNGLIQQQNNIKKNRNANNQQHNNISQQQVNNEAPYGKKVFDKRLTKLQELENTIEYNTNCMNAYINAQTNEKC